MNDKADKYRKYFYLCQGNCNPEFRKEYAKIAGMTENKLSGIIIDSAIKIHRKLGPGLLESAYQTCLKYELEKKRTEGDSRKAYACYL